MNSTNSTINFMYFLHNFTMDQVKLAMANTNSPEHLLAKFNSAGGQDGTRNLINTFMAMSYDNQILFTQWVESNYLAYKIFAE